MSECLSMHALGTRVVQRAREQEEKRTQERRRCLVYLIAEFLADQGYKDTWECLSREAQLSGDYQVCDNVDLDTILLEYTLHHHAKFGKRPRLCKRMETTTTTTTTTMQSSQITAEKKDKPNRTPASNAEKKCASDVDVNFDFTVVPILPPEAGDRPQCRATPEKDVFASERVVKPFGNLYPHGSELREIAATISRDIVLKKLNVHWEDIKGLDTCKTLLKEATVYPLKYPTLFNNKLGNWKGVLLYGPPGTGKTMLAKAVATECNATFFNITSSSVISKWRGDSEKYIRVLTDLALDYAPTIIFIDEIDWTATGNDDSSSSSEPVRRFRAELLARLDGLLSDDKSNVILLATTNVPWQIDVALLRRLERRIFVNLPDRNTRSEILRTYIHEDLQESNEFQSLVRNTEGYSCADLKLICKEAWMNKLRPIWKSLECGNIAPKDVRNDGVIDRMDFILNAMACVKPIGKNLTEQYKTWNKKFGFAQ